MAADQTLIPKDLRPLHINRTLVEEPRVSLRPAPVFCAPPPFTAAASLGSLVFANSSSVAPVPTTWVPRTAPPPTAAVGGENISSRSEEFGRGSGGGDQAPSKKVKFLCSFGGKILPRPSDGALRYVGGETRIVSLNRDAGLEELMQKMCEVCGKSVFIKYQLPDEDLDALVSVSGREDLVNMMEEYDKLVVGASSQEGGASSSPRLRIFLFSASELSDSPQLGHFSDLNDGNQRYVEAVNGIPDGGIRRKESAASSTTHSDGHGSSVGEVVDSGVSASHGGGEWPAGPFDFDGNRLVYLGPNSVMPVNLPPILTTDQPQGLLPSSRPDLEPVALSTTAYIYPEQKHLVDYSQRNSSSSASSQQILYLNPQSLGVSTPLVVGLSPPRPFPPTLQVGVGPSPSLGLGLGLRHNVVGQQYMQPVETYTDDTTVGTTRAVHLPSDRNYRVIQPQVPPPVEQMVKFEDCYLCKQALPHVHSDTILQDQGGGLVKTISEPNEIFQSSNFEESKILPNPFRVEATGATVGGRVEQQGEGAKLGYHGVGPLPRFGVHIDPTAHLGPVHQLGQFGPSQIPGVQHLENVDHTRQFGFSNVPTPRGQTGFLADRQIPYGVFAPQTSPPAVQDYSGKHPGFSPKEGIMDVPFSNGHVRMEALHLGPPEINEQYRLHIQPNNATFEDLKLENVPVVMESDNRVAEHFPLSSSNANVFVKPGVTRDGTYIKPIEPLAAASVVSSCSHNLQPLEPCQVSPLSGNPGHFPYLKTDVSSTVSNEMWHGNPTFSCINSEFEDIEQTPRKIFIDEALSGVGLSVPFANIIPGMVSGNQETVSSDTLFSSQDPWNRIQQAQQVHVPPPKPIRRVASGEALMPKDLIKQSHYGDHNGEPNTATEQEGGIHQPRESSESIRSSKGSVEEKIKQDLKAVAEGVAASVFQSSLHSGPMFSSVDVHEYIQEGRSHLSDGGSPNQNLQAKLLDKVTPGILITEDIGHLQIIKNSDLEELRELGSGTFGTVYHGKWRGTDVAIKRINDRCFTGKPSEQERLRADFWNEACKLADLHHPNVVAFYGVVLDGPGGSVATVTEYMVNGSLRNSLQRNDRILDWRKRLLIAMDVAFGMEYLHGKNIVHFDLKSDNLLVNLRDPQRPICKVGDLGLSKVKCQTLISGGVRGTLPWMAPELLNGSSSLVSEKVDVFSFGIVMWELLTGEEPYADLHYGAIIGGIVSNTLRPPVPKSCNPEWRSLMEKCWSPEPSERPSFTEVAGKLRSMAASPPLKGQAQHPSPPAQTQALK